MKHCTIRSSALLLAVALIAGCSPQGQELTLFAGVPGAAAPVAPGGTIPYRVGTSCYGWLLKFAPVAETVEVEEVLTLPQAARQWGAADGSEVADDNKSARTVVRVAGQQGSAQHSWCVAEGDPEGPYRFAISRDGRKVGELRFRVER